MEFLNYGGMPQRFLMQSETEIKVYLRDLYNSIVMDGEKRSYYQVAYLLADEKVIKREFGAYDNVDDNYNFSKDGIIHINIITSKLNIFSSFKYRLNKNRSAWVLKSELCHQS